MHIALVRRCCSLRRAGAEQYCVSLFRELQQLGHRVTILGEEIDEELRDEVEFIPVHVNHLASWTKNRSFAENVARIAAARSFDIVHGLSRAGGLDTYRLTDPLQTHWVNVFYRHPVERWLQHWNPRHRTILDIERRIYESGEVRRIITQSTLDSRLLTEYFRIPEDRICRIPNGVNMQVFHPGVRAYRREIRSQWNIADDEPLLVFAAMDFRRKALATLLAAIGRLPAKPRLLVLGEGDVPKYQRYAADLGIERQVVFAGRQAAIGKFYGAADLFVLPTIYEPFPNVNLEAMACGLPVITTETAGGADLVSPGKNGYLIPDAWSVGELTEQIAAYLAVSIEEREMMRAACVETARRFTLENNARQTVAVFHEVLREKFRV